jgi:hypothetical protein
MTPYSKRHAWIVAECRAWLKENKPDAYRRMLLICRSYFPDARRGHTDRQNLVTMTLQRVMRVHYREAWFQIHDRAAEIFEAPKTRLGHIAWDVALTLFDKSPNPSISSLRRDRARYRRRIRSIDNPRSKGIERPA